MLSRASMQATTATPLAGGSGRSPLSNASAYLWLLVSSSSVTLMLHSLLPETPPLLEQLMMAPGWPDASLHGLALIGGAALLSLGPLTLIHRDAEKVYSRNVGVLQLAFSETQ